MKCEQAPNWPPSIFSLLLVMVRLALSLAWSCIALAADPLGSIFDPAELRDAAGLDLAVSRRSPHSISSAPERSVERVELEFTSFEWQGETWRHRATVLIPDRVPDAYRGAAAVFSEVRPFDQSPTRGWAEQSALMGVTTLTISSGNPGPHYGWAREGDLMGYGQQRFQQTGDPMWIGYAWLGRVISRAATALAHTPGVEADRFVVTGCSKRGAAAWIAAGADERIVGAYPTCWNAGNTEAWLELKAERWGLDYQPRPDAKTIGPAWITTREQIANYNAPRGREYRRYTDPSAYRDRLKGKKIIFTAGTNDWLFPVMSDSVLLPLMGDSVRVQLLPNKGHTNRTRRNANAFLMLLSHVFAARGIPAIEVEGVPESDRLEVVVRVDAKTQVTAARVWFAADDHGAYFRDTEWESVELRNEGRTFRASIPALPGQYLGYFVEVEDIDSAGLPGTVTTGFQERPPMTQD